ncbi:MULTISPECIES: class I SAM-dependent methyltransferase [Aquitalea]|uniref:Methyltransferase family protein n=1 Tax=Aquitalea magnusonii TaxID=332411 RepID=A0A318J9G1_9NEIS|nr:MULTISPECIES: methyltransferase domain-containing protein [Aquitalea]PXX44704.1 methyltransferase family protein [Aquitalea magnusonii]
MMQAFSTWLATTELGHYLLECEQAFFDRAVADIFGFHAVQMGLPEVDFLAANRIPWQCRAAESGEAAQIICHPAQLPFESRSLDLLVMPHLLDFTTEPHQVLREVERVLVPEGRLLMTGFNPVSLWGVRRLIQGRADTPWRGNFFPLIRIRDWLKLLDLEPVAGCFMAYAPPVSQRDWLERFGFLERAGDKWWPLAAGVYGIEAIKRQRGMRLITPKWKAAKSAQGLVVAAGNERHPTRKQAATTAGARQPAQNDHARSAGRGGTDRDT